VAANCAALPTANAGQEATSSCKPPLFWFACKQRYINVQTFNPLLTNVSTSLKCGFIVVIFILIIVTFVSADANTITTFHILSSEK